MPTARPGKKPAKLEAAARAEAHSKVAPQWTIFSNHAHVLVCIARNPEERVRDIAQMVGITERAVHRIIGDLEQGGVIARERQGRRNRYNLSLDRPLRHPLEAHRTIAEVIRVIQS